MAKSFKSIKAFGSAHRLPGATIEGAGRGQAGWGHGMASHGMGSHITTENQPQALQAEPRDGRERCKDKGGVIFKRCGCRGVGRRNNYGDGVIMQPCLTPQGEVTEDRGALETSVLTPALPAISQIRNHYPLVEDGTGRPQRTCWSRCVPHTIPSPPKTSIVTPPACCRRTCLAHGDR